MAKTLIPMTDPVYDGLVQLVSESIDLVDEKTFSTRREYLGRIAELNEMLDALQSARN